MWIHPTALVFSSMETCWLCGCFAFKFNQTELQWNKQGVCKVQPLEHSKPWETMHLYLRALELTPGHSQSTAALTLNLRLTASMPAFLNTYICIYMRLLPGEGTGCFPRKLKTETVFIASPWVNKHTSETHKHRLYLSVSVSTSNC